MATMSTAARSASLPPFLYVLAAFGVIAGSFGGLQSIGNGVLSTKPREVYVEAARASNESFKPLVPDAEIERYSVREADVRYGRRNAALPLAIVGLILSMLLFAGAMRAMRGEAWGLSAWQLAAAASLPYQLLSTILAIATAHDLTRAFADVPSTAMLLVAKIELEKLKEILFGGIAVLYFGTCVLYLRTPEVRRHFSDDAGRTPPSA
jgi:hypothetical protein